MSRKEKNEYHSSYDKTYRWNHWNNWVSLKLLQANLVKKEYIEQGNRQA